MADSALTVCLHFYWKKIAINSSIVYISKCDRFCKIALQYLYNDVLRFSLNAFNKSIMFIQKCFHLYKRLHYRMLEINKCFLKRK